MFGLFIHGKMLPTMRDDLMVQQQVDNVWQHMVGVICLNCTNRKQVKAVLPTFLLNGLHTKPFYMQLKKVKLKILLHL